MAYFPIFTDLSHQKCIIFGGGKVAFRKIESLMKYDADVEVISLDFDPEIEKILPEDKLHQEAIEKDNMLSWLSQADFVIAATSSRRINQSISSWCHENHILVDVIDAPGECTFLFPSIVKRGEISIGINTGGKSPIVSKKIRQEIEKAIPEYYGEIADQLGQVRIYVKEHFPEEGDRRRILKEVAGQAFVRERALLEEELLEILK
ncbi:MAG: bifunctional precorrin-2 dehydrogenase/sirohydrochlorin ferrochelatase [Eubacteriales bacterium]|nr:bifunctional precorrin-2 dehydrogenase/sirohydrochlorin ferrochelatase [Eubacteriales bacterium]